jgi:diguanylate cyclase (GGDEF)-like protein/hemerythrin-like metal-binding protein
MSVNKHLSFRQLPSVKRTLSVALDRHALPLSLLIFLVVFWADQQFSDDLSFTPFYCLAIALLAWYRSAAWAYPAAVCAVLLDLHNTPGWATGQATVARLALTSLPNLLLFAGFAFVTLQARSHFNRLNHSVDLLERLAFHDPLTALPNRPLLYDRLAIAISLARRAHSKVAILLLDLDGFKNINDRHGHHAGDEVLKAVANRLAVLVRGGDTVARLGGDEFAIVLADVSDPHDATSVAEKVLLSVAEPIAARDGGTHQIGVSIGITVFPDHGNEIDNLLANADAAMYESKGRGKSTYTFFSEPDALRSESSWIVFNRSHETGSPEMDQQHKQLIALANQLNVSINAGESTELIGRQFEELVLYTRFHFSTEERLMEQNGYPDQHEHRQSHLRLLSDIGHIKARLHQGSELIALQTIKDWLLGHIETSDKLLGAYLRQHEDD